MSERAASSSTLGPLASSPSPALSESARRDAQHEESERVSIEAIRKLNATLEERVQARTTELECAMAKIQAHNTLIEAVRDAQSRFIASVNPLEIFEGLLKSFLKLTGSEYGYIHELLKGPDGQLHATALATTDAAWSEEVGKRRPPVPGSDGDASLPSLFGAVVSTGAAVISKDIAADPRCADAPAGHPPIRTFLGLPIHANKELVGVIGLANGNGLDDDTVAYLVPLAVLCGTIIGASRVDELRRAEEGLRRANAELVNQKLALARANEELEAFSYSVSHDLRAPLRGIDGFSRVVLDEYAAVLPEDAVRMLGIVRAGAQQMGHLIDDLLTFSRLSRHELATREVDIAALFRQIAREINAETKGRQVEVTVGALPRCKADPDLLRQVIRNLVSNAVKYSRKVEVPVIEVGATPPDASGLQEYFIRDNGVGFDMQYADKLFGVFQRLHRAEDYEGTGVGLAIVARILTRHGGRIWAESEVNRGSTFHFTLEKGSTR